MKALIGKVVSGKMQKTVVVEVIHQKLHPKYKKIIRRTRRYKVHHTDANIKEGNTVKIIACRPLSKSKHYKIDKILN